MANTSYGPVQIQLIERSGKIVKVAVLVQPTNTLHDVQIGEFAFPKLISETLTAQNAKIDAVSGATYTSAGYVQSLQSALDKTHLTCRGETSGAGTPSTSWARSCRSTCPPGPGSPGATDPWAGRCAGCTG